jgi:hypothetical protein
MKWPSVGDTPRRTVMRVGISWWLCRENNVSFLACFVAVVVAVVAGAVFVVVVECTFKEVGCVPMWFRLSE